MFEQAFPLQFEDPLTGLSLHIASYTTIKKRRCWHCFVSENDVYLGYVILHQINSNVAPSTLLMYKNTVKDTIPIQNMASIMEYCQKTVKLSCHVGKTYSFLRQNRVSFTPSLRYPTPIWHPLFRSRTFIPQPRPLEIVETCLTTFPSPWCEEESTFCMKYGGIPDKLFLKVKEKMILADPTPKSSIIETTIHPKVLSDSEKEENTMVDSSANEIVISESWYKLAHLCGLSLSHSNISSTQLKKQNTEGLGLSESSFVCRHHLVQSALLTKSNQVLDAAILLHQQMNTIKKEPQNTQATQAIQKRMAHLVDYTAEQGNLGALRIFLHSPLLTCSIEYKDKASSSNKQSMQTPRFCSQRALYFAASNGHEEVVRVLLKQKAPARPEAIYTVCRNGRKDILFQLLDAGVRCDFQEALQCAVCNSQWELAKSLAQWIQEISWIGVFAVPETYSNMDPASCSIQDKQKNCPFQIWTQCHEIIGWITACYSILLK